MKTKFVWQALGTQNIHLSHPTFQSAWGNLGTQEFSSCGRRKDTDQFLLVLTKETKNNTIRPQANSFIKLMSAVAWFENLVKGVDILLRKMDINGILCSLRGSWTPEAHSRAELLNCKICSKVASLGLKR